MPKLLDLTGHKYGLLTPLEYKGGSYWLCRCDCGETALVTAGRMRSGNTTSCGCHKRSVLGLSTTKHGKTGTRVHRIWKGMRNRCNNEATPRYKDYGGRGIRVCARWDSFENFYADMGDPPEGLTLDREDNDGDYEPSNCRWATQAEQQANKRRKNK